MNWGAWCADADIQKTVTDRRANMEYDFKRELVEPVEMFVGRNFGSANQPHLSLQSKPHRTLEDFQTMRTRFDQWRVKQSGVLKNMLIGNGGTLSGKPLNYAVPAY